MIARAVQKLLKRQLCGVCARPGSFSKFGYLSGLQSNTHIYIYIYIYIVYVYVYPFTYVLHKGHSATTEVLTRESHASDLGFYPMSGCIACPINHNSPGEPEQNVFWIGEPGQNQNNGNTTHKANFHFKFGAGFPRKTRREI